MSADLDLTTSELRPKMWRNLLFFLGSAAFGGLAVAFWNRRELTQIQKERSKQVTAPVSAGDSEEEIF